MSAEDLPRIIWTYWHDGEEKAPPLVQMCIQSWRQRNSEWEVRVLDEAQSQVMCDLSYFPKTISYVHQTDCLRLQLLARYGGVWADATTLCTRPLDA